MADARVAIPGTWLVISLLAAAVTAAVWLALERPVLLESRPADRAADAMRWPDMRVDLNAAGVAELDLLQGIGPRLAERIIADRNRRGRFASVDDLVRVSGIGPRTIDRIRPHVVARIQESGVRIQQSPER